MSVLPFVSPLEEPEPPPRIGRTLAEFLADDSAGVSWTAHGVAVDGGLIAVLGFPETFKTQAVMSLGLSLAAGASEWLGVTLGPRRPFCYVSAEKAASTVRAKLARISAALPPVEPVYVIHRGGVTFGNRDRWSQLVEEVAALGPRTVVALDTLASLAGVGFDENRGQDMSVAVASARQLCDTGATVFLIHHPSKHGHGTGGIRLRGHTSLWGEADGVMEFTRPDRDTLGGSIRVEPKDGDLSIIRFTWNPNTFLLATETGIRILTAATVAQEVELLDDGTGVTSDEIASRFTNAGRTAVMDRISEAVRDGLIDKSGRAKSTRYHRSGGRMADEWGFEGVDE